MNKNDCVFILEIDENIDFSLEEQRKQIEAAVYNYNEFVEHGEDIRFVDNMYAKLSDESYDGKRECYIFKKKEQHMPEELFNKNFNKLKNMINDNDAIIWEHPQETRITSISKSVVLSPKKTALLFEEWMREENPLKFNYDDICVKFEDRNEEEYFVVRMNDRFIKKVKIA